jgi:hypothetical protein
MKKLALAAFGAALLAAPSVVSAQATATGSINAVAIVPTQMTFGTSSPIDFGSVVPGTTSAAASGSIAFTRNVGVIFTLPDAAATGRLTRVGGTETLQPAFTSCGVGTSSTAIVSATAFNSCAPTGATTPVLTLASPTTGPTAEFIIFNGTVSVPANAPGGTYTGVIRITATAN